VANNEPPEHSLDETHPEAQPELFTERLLLRPFNTITDPPVVQQILQCREIAANTRTIPHPYPEGAALVWINTHADLWRLGKAAIFAICLREEPDRPIGAIGMHIDAEHEHAEMGYWIDPECWRGGICTEAARRLLAFGFQELGLHRIHAHHLARNPASGRVLQKIGMQREGLFREHVRKWGVFEDAVFYAMLASDFREP
jgi:RimJ/RimL family protein N-acetyltransferase